MNQVIKTFSLPESEFEKSITNFYNKCANSRERRPSYYTMFLGIETKIHVEFDKPEEVIKERIAEIIRNQEITKKTVGKNF